MQLIGVREMPDPRGHTVLVRASLNVPVDKGEVQNKYRLEAAKPTIQFLRERGAKVVLLSHIDGGPAASLEPVARYLRTSIPLTYVNDVVGVGAHTAVNAMKPGDVVVLENLRRNAGEEACDEHFVRELASLGDLYVNDDFAAAHRGHASIVGLPAIMPGFAGLQFMREVEGLSRALIPESPSLAIVGGAKFVTKEPLIKRFLELYDHVFVSGALANDFFKAQRFEVGRSLVSNAPDLGEYLKNSKIILPIDVTVDGVHGKEIKKLDEVVASDTIYDVGPATLATLTPLINKARTVVWNGPLGNFEKGFKEQTEALAKIIADAPGYSAVGGGDTIASIEKLGLNDKFEFLSTAGGAMLSYLARGTLPGIEALEQSKKIA